MRHLFYLLFFCVSYVSSMAQTQSITALSPASTILLTCTSSMSPEALVLECNAAGVRTISMELIAPVIHTWKVDLYPGQDLAKAVEQLEKKSWVKSAMVNTPLQFRGDTIPNDPQYTDQWALTQIEANAAWRFNTSGVNPLGDTIVIAVLEKYIDQDHIDLKPNMFVNHGEIPMDNIDNDNNGLVDDYRGYDFFTNSPTSTLTSSSHGMRVSGIIGAVGNNNNQISGVNWHIKMLYLGVNYPDDVIEAYQHIYNERKKYNESNGEEGLFIVAANLSFGLDNVVCDANHSWNLAFEKAGEQGILSVASGPNIRTNIDETGDLPGTCPSDHVLIVTAITKDENIDQFCFGVKNVDIGAPNRVTSLDLGNGVSSSATGNSFACPHVTAAAGLLYSMPSIDLANLAINKPSEASLFMKRLIIDSAKPLTDLEGKVASGGSLNLNNAVTMLHAWTLASESERVSKDYDQFIGPPSFLKVYPNPVNRILNITWSSQDFKGYEMRLLDTSGKLVRIIPLWTQPFESQSEEIDMLSLPSGVYFLEMIGTDKKIFHKVIKG